MNDHLCAEAALLTDRTLTIVLLRERRGRAFVAAPPPPPAKTLQPPDHQSGKSIAVLGRQMPVSPTLQKLQLFRRSLSSRFYITCPSRAKSLPVMCGTRSAGFADECEVKRMSQNGSTRSPSVILADNNPAYSYGYEAPKPSNAPGG